MGRYLKTPELKQYEAWRRLEAEGRLLTPEKLRFICDINRWDAEEVGKAIMQAVLEAERRK